MPLTLRPWLYWTLPAWLWTGILLILTSLPSLDPPPLGITFADKIYHALAYALLGLLLMRARQAGQPARSIYASRGLLTIGIPFALFDELHQALIPGRYCDALDFGADLAGLLLAFLLQRTAGAWLMRQDSLIYNHLKSRLPQDHPS